MIFLALFFFNLAKAEASPALVIHNISLFRNEIQLDVKKSQVKVGTKLSARSAVNHKCLLVVTRVVKDLAYADATQCPGYATLKKGQEVSLSSDSEVNEEVRVLPTPALNP